ncbi:hypothetical protein TruAng_007243 [Truncatella angustata]|nr:hypothetical protein TruAng_007243 [Truncatella angustata]
MWNIVRTIATGLAYTTLVAAVIKQPHEKTPPHEDHEASPEDRDIIPGKWIVTFKDNVPDHAFTRFQQHIHKRSEDGAFKVNHVYDMAAGAFRGLSLDGPADAVEAMGEHEWVKRVEPDRWIHLAEDRTNGKDTESFEPGDEKQPGNAYWNLDMISHPKRLKEASNPEYTCTGSCGAGIDIYIIDTGINNHTEFEGRLTHEYSACALEGDRGYGAGDSEGHGTHVAAIAAGATRGVARKANIISIRAFCSYSCTYLVQPFRAKRLARKILTSLFN